MVGCFENLDKLDLTYKKWDELILNVKNTYHIDCLYHCGECCFTDVNQIEASLFEMLPLAIKIYLAGNIKYFLRKTIINKRQSLNQCLFVNSSPDFQKYWYCSEYHDRPSVCRLFGFTSKKDKHGIPVYTLCKPMKSYYSETGNSDFKFVPIMGNLYQEILNLNPNLTQSLMPLNTAFFEAYNLVSLKAGYLGISPGSSDDTPNKPIRPKRKKIA